MIHGTVETVLLCRVHVVHFICTENNFKNPNALTFQSTLSYSVDSLIRRRSMSMKVMFNLTTDTIKYTKTSFSQGVFNINSVNNVIYTMTDM